MDVGPHPLRRNIVNQFDNRTMADVNMSSEEETVCPGPTVLLGAGVCWE